MIPQAAFEIQDLLSFASAVLGGFSIALAIGLLQLDIESRLMKVLTGLAILSSIVLIFATVTGTFGAIWIAERPALESLKLSETPSPVLLSFQWSGSSFLFGMGCILLTMGLGRLYSLPGVGLDYPECIGSHHLCASVLSSPNRGRHLNRKRIALDCARCAFPLRRRVGPWYDRKSHAILYLK